jgi:hypothetical protein
MNEAPVLKTEREHATNSYTPALILLSDFKLFCLSVSSWQPSVFSHLAIPGQKNKPTVRIAIFSIVKFQLPAGKSDYTPIIFFALDPLFCVIHVYY